MDAISLAEASVGYGGRVSILRRLFVVFLTVLGFWGNTGSVLCAACCAGDAVAQAAAAERAEGPEVSSAAEDDDDDCTESAGRSCLSCCQPMAAPPAAMALLLPSCGPATLPNSPVGRPLTADPSPLLQVPIAA